MKKSTISKQWSYLTDLVSTNAVKSRRLSLLMLMLLTLLFVPTRMVAQTTTDHRCALFNKLDGITNVTITDDGSYPWQMLNLEADGMKNLGFDIPEGSTGLMSSNYLVDNTTSKTVVNFTVTKPILLTFKYLVSSEYYDWATITLDNKEYGTIREIKQIEIKEFLSVGEHTLALSYSKDNSYNKGADRAFIYNLETAATISDYVAEYNAKNTTLTFKKVIDANISDIVNNSVFVDKYINVKEICTALGNVTIKNIVFDESFAGYAPTSLKEFFKDCETMETISGLEYLNTKNVTDMQYMFYRCKALTSLDLSKFNTENVTNMWAMFDNCSALTSLDLTNFNTEKVTNMLYMFYGCSDLTSLNLSNFNTEKVTNMAYMFADCKKLSTLDLSKFNTTKVTDMSGMFNGCSNLPSLNLTNFKTANVTNMASMFNGCFALTSLDLTKFNTENVTDMASMFNGCSALTSLDLTKFNTAKVTYMSYMFANCKKLSSLDLSKFNTENVKYMGGMFNGCSALTSLDLSYFKTANVTDMSHMFDGCSALTSLDLTNFNTEKVTNMSQMFLNCKALKSLDLTKFNTAKVTDMSYMFYRCNALTTIYASDNFKTEKVGKSSKMFWECNNLKGFIEYNKNKTDLQYANYKTGYFTKLVVRNGDERYGIAGETTQLTVDNLALDDAKDFVVYEPFTAKAASYSRTMTGTKWATLCLPFEVSLNGQDFRAFKLLSANEGTNTVELEEITTSIAAGTPVIIKMNEGVTALNFSVDNKEIANEVKTSATANNNYQLQGIYTKKVFDKDADNNCYIVKGDKLMNPAKLLENTNTKTVGSKPFRAYMVDNSTAPAAGAKMYSIAIGGGTTAIDSLNTIADDNATYYDLQGHRLNSPQKGINIVKRGGKTMKVIIK